MADRLLGALQAFVDAGAGSRCRVPSPWPSCPRMRWLADGCISRSLPPDRFCLGPSLGRISWGEYASRKLPHKARNALVSTARECTSGWLNNDPRHPRLPGAIGEGSIAEQSLAEMLHQEMTQLRWRPLVTFFLTINKPFIVGKVPSGVDRRIAELTGGRFSRVNGYAERYCRAAATGRMCAATAPG